MVRREIMNTNNLKRVCHYIIFAILLILAIGYLPSQIGVCLLCMAMMACPVSAVHRAVDFVLETCSMRITWFAILLIFMGYYPLEQFGIIEDRIRYIFDLLSSLIN